MKRNIGSADKAIRIVIAIIAAVLFFTNAITGTLGYIILAFGAIMLATALVNFCGLYAPFGINTCKRCRAEEP